MGLWVGWAIGAILALVVSVAFPVGFIGGLLIGLGFSGTGMLIGRAVDDRRV